MRIRDVMTKRVLALRPEDSLRTAISVFSKNGITGAPVVDKKGRVVGILTEMDILRRLELGALELPRSADSLPGREAEDPGGDGLRLKSLAEALEGLGDLSVSKLMTSPVVTARPDDLVSEKVTFMVHRRIRRLPVVDRHGVLVGILSRKDLIRMLDRAGRKKEPARSPSKGAAGGGKA